MSPAPWTVNSSGGAVTIVARDRSVVAVVLGSDASAPFDRSNADLMAAAPDLYAAMVELSDLCPRMNDDDPIGPAIRDAVMRGRAALRKANGP